MYTTGIRISQCYLYNVEAVRLQGNIKHYIKRYISHQPSPRSALHSTITARVPKRNMKVILTGATGFIGGEVLHQALAAPSITSLICLTRRPLPAAAVSNPKLQTIQLTDFTSYPPELLSQLEGAECCIWCVLRPRKHLVRTTADDAD